MSLSPQEACKKNAAQRAVEECLYSKSVIGIGSGSTIVYAVEWLAKRYFQGDIQEIQCIPSSFQARQLILKYKLPLGDLEQYPTIDVAIDGADEVDKISLHLIKGGGGCLLQEKIVAFSAKQLIIIADHTKEATYLGERWKKGLPMEVIPMAYRMIQEYIQRKWAGEAILRQAIAKAGPVVTDNGNFLLDVHFDWKSIAADKDGIQNLEHALIQIPGVVETGLFLSMTSCVYLGREDGQVDVLTTKNRK